MIYETLTKQIAHVLNEHRHASGMVVASGHTCRCGYWTGNEQPGVTRPPGFQGLDWHQAEMITKAIHAVPDETELDRGFGNCPHCRSPLIARCHECLNEIERDAAPGAGWRMDHLSGFGCIALCPDHR